MVGIRVVGRSEEPLGSTGGGVSGVLKFAVRPESERAVARGKLYGGSL